MRDYDIWEEHLKGLTRQLHLMIERVQTVEERLDYYENVMLTLLVALKKGGIIVEDDSGEHNMPS
tara:strand:- start:363 stop:557 length:195 start_codon:yes stop_codon:yes gene_type:complete